MKPYSVSFKRFGKPVMEEFDDLSPALERNRSLRSLGYQSKLIRPPGDVLIVYPSDDNRTVKDFHGQHVGDVVSVNSYKFGKRPGDIMFTYRVRSGGRLWSGRGLGENMSLTLRPLKK